MRVIRANWSCRHLREFADHSSSPLIYFPRLCHRLPRAPHGLLNSPSPWFQHRLRPPLAPSAVWLTVDDAGPLPVSDNLRVGSPSSTAVSWLTTLARWYRLPTFVRGSATSVRLSTPDSAVFDYVRDCSYRGQRSLFNLSVFGNSQNLLKFFECRAAMLDHWPQSVKAQEGHFCRVLSLSSLKMADYYNLRFEILSATFLVHPVLIRVSGRHSKAVHYSWVSCQQE